MSFFHRHSWLTPYVLLAPGLVFLFVFFVIPLYYLGFTSLQEGTVQTGYSFSWAWDNYSEAFSTYQAQFFRSFQYAGIATILALLISYPLTYWIAFRGGRWKNLLLLCIIAPFFVTYLIRTLAWQNILADDGFVVNVFQFVGLVPDDGRVLATSTAVIAGITYNFLPFMALPLYVSLEQIDKSLIEAAKDLYASSTKAFLRVTLPLSMPGVIAGTLLTFIPAAGDFINAELLGTPNQAMIGNVIQSKFLEITDYGQAAALSVILMLVILGLILVYTRLLGTERMAG
jgi:spermidine/putrescine transport system permease protein